MGSWYWGATAGAFAAAAGLARPVGLLLVPIPVLAVLLWRHGSRRMRLAAAGLAAAGALGVIVLYLGILAVAPGDPVIPRPDGGQVVARLIPDGRHRERP